MRRFEPVMRVHHRLCRALALRMAVEVCASAVAMDVPREITPRGLSRSAACRDGLSLQLADPRALEVVRDYAYTCIGGDCVVCP